MQLEVNLAILGAMTEARDYLQDYIAKATPVIDCFFQKEIKNAAKITPEIVQMLEIYHRLLGKGKKLRGALVKLGYELAGGRRQKSIIEASISIEIIHAFLLIHDDIIDRDALRRGQPTVHKQYEKIFKRFGSAEEAVHSGLSLAIIEGDIGCFLGHLALMESGFSSEVKAKAETELDRLLLEVAYGEALDVFYEHRGKASEEDILRIHRLKTGVYTGSGPLAIGAILAGAKKNYLSLLSRFGLPLGIAFQIRSDEIGLFLDEGQIGKPTGSDIREDKNTLLKIKAFEKATPKQRQFLTKAYGNLALSRKEIVKVRQITKETGAYEYSHQLGLELVGKAKKYVRQITKDKKKQKLLSNLADFMMAREK